ncbi:MAG TPA: 5-(carboxyamino)imidazole ribonucleotide synthase [Actinomycetes bacterium]|nr:5-(carboxyamino)imidazole ribonucleotide synthase [Actinomycetes bacterium]
MVGAGQLARMTYQAAVDLGIELEVLAAGRHDPAAQVAAGVALGAPTDARALTALADRCDVLTFDHELVDLELLGRLEAAGHVLRPSPAALLAAVDKRHQRARLAAAGLPVPAARPAGDAAEVAAFAGEHGWPVVLKAARGGYDGRGVWVVDGPAPAAARVAAAGGRGVPLLVEAFVPIEREVAVLVARRPGGQAVVWDVVETVQQEGICRELLAPARVPGPLAARARSLGTRIAELLGVVGLLAVELFVAGDELLVNELAMRPHNSGHHTIEGAVTSQFGNHLRAVLDLPLGSTAASAPAAATVNVLGGPDGADPRDRLRQALAVDGVRVHLYGKAPRPGRKLGHVTALGGELDEALARARAAAAALVAPATA